MKFIQSLLLDLRLFPWRTLLSRGYSSFAFMSAVVWPTFLLMVHYACEEGPINKDSIEIMWSLELVTFGALVAISFMWGYSEALIQREKFKRIMEQLTENLEE